MKNVLIFFLFSSVSVFGQTDNFVVDALVTPQIQERTFTVGDKDADIQGFSNQEIQFAINLLSTSGGTVKLSPGTYTIKAPVLLKSNIKLIGSGKETILKKDKGVQTPYIVDADFAELRIVVEDPTGFELGMKIQVSDDDNSGCWNVSTAYITDIQDNVIYIDKYLIRDYQADRNGLISNAGSVIDVLEAENVMQEYNTFLSQ